MVYAYDKIMPMPTKDLYDTLLMAMAINAAKDQYDRAEKRLDDLENQLGDFLSPFAKDVDWYKKNVEDPIVNSINDLYNQGYDLRSPEFRLKLEQLRRSLPMAQIAQMKQNAKIGTLYKQAEAELRAKNLFSQEMSDWEDAFNDFQTVGDGGRINSWLKQSPSAYYNIDQLLEPIVKNVKPIYDEERSNKEPGKVYTTVTLPRLMSAFNDSMADILNTPSGRYLLHQSLQEADLINKENPDANVSAMDVLRNRAANRLKDNVQESWTYDPLYLKQVEHKNRMSEARYAASLNNPNPENRPLQFSERIQSMIGRTYNKQVLALAKEYAIANRDFRAKQELKNNGKSSTKYDSKFWGRLVDDINAGKNVDLYKWGLQDKNGNPSQKLMTFFTKYLHNIGTAEAADTYWNSRSYTPASKYEADIFKQLFAGSNRTAKIFGTDHNVISLGDRGVNYAPYRKYGLLGNTKQLSNALKEFSAFINQQNIFGYVDNDVTRLANIPTTYGDNITDLQDNVLIHEDDFINFAKLYYNSKNKPLKEDGSDVDMENEKNIEKLDQLAKQLKLSKRTDKTSTNLDTYYVMPTIRSMNITTDDINQQYNNDVFGATNAEIERNVATNAGLEWLMNN